MDAERERWRKCNWGYPAEFLEAERGLLGICQPVEPKSCTESVPSRRLDSLKMELRHLTNRVNEHLDKKNPVKGKSTYKLSQDIQETQDIQGVQENQGIQ